MTTLHEPPPTHTLSTVPSSIAFVTNLGVSYRGLSVSRRWTAGGRVLPVLLSDVSRCLQPPATELVQSRG